MPRQIVTNEFVRLQKQAAYPANVGSGTRETSADDYTSKVVKLIPTEAVAMYLFLSGVIGAARPEETDRGPALTLVFIVLLVLTVPYLTRVAGVRNSMQLAISAAAFPVWVFSLGGPFLYLMPLVGLQYDQLWGAIFLPLFTFAVPIIDKSYTGPQP